MRVSDGRRRSHDAGSRRRTPGDTARAASPIPPVARRGDNPPTGPPLVRGPPLGDLTMLTLDHARVRHDATASLRAAAIDACRRAVDACARRMLAATGTPDDADDRLRLAMDGVEVLGATAGVLARASPHATSALSLAESVAEGCAIAFERDGENDATARACRECARSCRALRASVAPARLRCAAG